MIAIDTIGVGTRIALAVSFPFNAGNALATALPAPVSVKNLLRSASTTTVLWMKIIDQVLIVGIGMNSFNMARFNTIRIVHGF